MKPFHSPLIVLAVLVLVTTSPGVVRGQVLDHLECYKISDPLKLAGVIDLDSPQFGAEVGCCALERHHESEGVRPLQGNDAGYSTYRG